MSHTTLSLIESETLDTFYKLEKSKKLHSFLKTKSFLTMGVAALGATVAAGSSVYMLLGNDPNFFLSGSATAVGLIFSVGFGEEGFKSLQSAKEEEAMALTLSEKITMLRDKLKKSDNITPINTVNKPV